MSETSAADAMHEAIRLLESIASGARGQGFGSRSLSNPELIELVTLGEQAGRLVDALRSEVAHEVDARTHRTAPADPKDSLAHSYGYASSHALLQQLTLASRATITKRMRVANHCRTRTSLFGDELPGTFPHVGGALFSGRLSIDTAEVITRMLDKLPSTVPTELIEVAERNLVSHATGTTLIEGVWDDNADNVYGGAPGIPAHTADVEQLAQGWVAAIDQDGTLPREEVLSRRFVRLGRERHGLVPVHGALLPEAAAMFERMCDAILNPRIAPREQRNADLNETARSGHDDGREASDRASGVRFVPASEPDPADVRDKRTADQKRHDALATMFGVAMKHDDMPRHNGEALTLTIQVTDTDLAKRRGTAWIPSNGGLIPVDSGSARHAGCVGSILRVTQDEAGRIIDLETTARVFNAHQRRAIMLRDGGCIIPGCTQSATWCEVHHVTEWHQGGTTHTDNGVLLCWFHHRHLETHGWQVRMNDGTPEVAAPAWLDPEQHWRQARSVHKRPQIHATGAPPKRRPRRHAEPTVARRQPATAHPSSTRALDACTTVRNTTCYAEPGRHGSRPTLDVSWASTSIAYLATT